MVNSPSIYSDIELSTEVMSASKHRLIQLLFEKFLVHIQTAKKFMQENDILNRNNAISKANDIITYLRSCLNFDDAETKKMSEQLDSTYVIVQKCLLNAMLKNDIEYLELASTMVNNVKSGWDEIGK